MTRRVVWLFPAPVRGAGAGWAMGIGRIGSIVGPVLGGVLISGKPDMTSLFELLAVTVGVAALAIGLSAFVRPVEIGRASCRERV